MQNKCPQYPGIEDLKFNNLYWQVLKTKKETYYLKDAFLDVREKNTKGSLVRIIGVASDARKEELSCNFWFKSSTSDSVLSPVMDVQYLTQFEYRDYLSDYLWPFLMTCKIPDKYEDLVPDSVSLSGGKSCEKLTNNLR